MPRKNHWACHLTQNGFTGGLIASSYAEATGSSEGQWFQKPRNTLVEVFSHCFEKEEYEIKKEEMLLAEVVMRARHGVRTDPPLVAECRSMFSGYVTELLLAEVIDSANYTAFIADGSRQAAHTICSGVSEIPTTIQVIVKRNILTEKQRTVTFQMENKVVKFVGGCDCPAVVNCGHPCKHILCACVLLSAQLSVNLKFSHLKHLFNPRYVLKETVQLLGTGRLIETHANITSAGAGDDNDICVDESPDFGGDNVNGSPDMEGASEEHFGTQLTQPQTHTTKAGRLPHASFDRIRAEVTPLCQAGSRNNHVGNALIEIFKAMHTAILAMSPDQQKAATAGSLLAACEVSLGFGCATSTTLNGAGIDARGGGTQNSIVAYVAQDHTGVQALSAPPETKHTN